jgi:phosphoglycolate phosphatase
LAILTCPDVQFKDIRAVFFDKDGTMAAVEAYLRCLTEQFLQSLDAGAGISELIRSCYGVFSDGVDPNGLMAIASRQTCTEIAVEILVTQGVDPDQAQQNVHQAFERAERSLPRKAPITPLIPGILDLLIELQHHQVAIGILTSDSPENLQDFITYYDLGNTIQLAWGSTAGALSKPEPAFYQQACERLGVLPNQTVMIGDAQADCDMAQRAGANAIAVTWGWTCDRKPQVTKCVALVTQPQAINATSP